MAAGVAFLWLSRWIMRDLIEPDSPAQELDHDLDRPVGVTLVVLRVGARFAAGAPALPARLWRRDRRLAAFGHVGLSALAAMALVTGWALTDCGGRGVTWFGLAMPQIFPVRETILGVATDPLASNAHESLACGLLAPVLGHVAAVAKHRLKDGDDLPPRIALSLRAGVRRL